MAGKSGAMKRDAAQLTRTKAPAAPKPVAARAPGAHEDAGLDRLIYERVRLGIMSALAMNEQLSYVHYVCLQVNFRGSAGYGEAFQRKIMGDWGSRGFPDHMAVADAAIDGRAAPVLS